MKRALITGGSGDIGSAICKRLATSNIHVIIHANQHLEQAGTVVESIQAAGGSAEAVACDLSDSAATEDTLQRILQQGPVQILIHNAGIHDDAPMAGMSLSQWKRVIDVSLNGFFNIAQPLLLPMIGTRWGRIIGLSSVAGVMGNRGQANYAAAKSGLHGACKSLAIELASRGITANVVAPGIIQGKLTTEAFDRERIERLVPMKRAGTPEEVAALVNYLASDEAAYVSGQIISINGAMA
jgi:3-oxoacyl-[acyl-carrier protein] reductase